MNHPHPPFPLRALLPAFLLLLLLPAVPASAQDAAATPRLEAPFTDISKPAGHGTHDPTRLRVCTWNIEWFPAGQRKGALQNATWQTAAAANLIRKTKPDLLLVQEVRNLKALLALNQNLNPPGFSHIACAWFYNVNDPAKLNPDDIQQQCGLLSRLPWKEIWEADFATLPNPKPARGWIAAAFHLSGLNITVYNGHLKSNFGAKSPDDETRNRELRRLAIVELQNDLKRRGLDPLRDRIIVGGDFNTDFFNPDFASETVFKELDGLGFRNCLAALGHDARVSIPAREGEPWPDSTFDYLFVSAAWGTIPTAVILPEGASKRKDVFGGDEPGLASDHYPVYIDLPLP